MTLEELNALDGPAPAAPQPPAAPPAKAGGLTLADIAALDTPTQPSSDRKGGDSFSLADLDALDPAPPAAPATPLPTVNGNELDASGQIGGAMLTGAAKSLYESRDFLFGKPAESEKTGLRRSIEELDRNLGEASIANSFVSGLSQFAVGMLGAGKLVSAAKVVPGVAGAAASVGRVGGAVLEGAGGGASATFGAGSAVGAQLGRAAATAAPASLKAAAVGAVAFDPNGPRLSDLVVLKGPSWLQNPVSDYLAQHGHEGDPAALGRMRNALESIGIDAAFAGVFAASVKGYAALKAYHAGTGSAEAAQAAQQELVQALAHKEAKLAASKGDLETVEALRESHPEAVAEAERVLAERTAPAVAPEASGETTITPRPDGPAEATLPELSSDPAAPKLRDTTGVARERSETISGPAEPTAPSPAAQWAPPRIEVTDDQLASLIRHTQADTEALMGPGGWDGAIARGYRFGDGGNIPWQKLSIEEGHAPGQAPLDQIIRRVSETFAADIAAARNGDKPGGVRSDAFQDRLVQQRVAIYGDDPTELMGRLQLAGSSADNLVADVAAADLVTLRASQEAQNLAARIRLGALEEYGGDLSAAMAALRSHLKLAATARAESSAMVANAARTLRRQRSEFNYKPEDLARLDSMSDAKLLDFVEAAGRDPAVADRLLRRGFWSAIRDDASYLYVNNLLWGLRTHFVNFSTNSYMLVGRPLERMLGGLAQGDRALVAENARQYGYMAGSIHEAWRDAVRTWQTGESILAPHAPEVSAASAGRSMNWAAEGFKPASSVPNILSNAYTGFMKAAGLPTRALGSVDELVKQVVYRSKVMAGAHSEGIAAGLEGAELSAHVRRTLNSAFDDAGKATDLRALDEANIATFQQDLLPGTMGARVQGFVGDSTALRIVLPFIRTPTNVLRMGWKLTPGLNLAQKEYRQMLRGEMGSEAQAQAMGQFAMGSLFLGVAGLITHAGYVTGGGPLEPNLRRQLMATGWQPYSFAVPQADGSVSYVNFGRYDPIAMPFGIMADVVDILERDQDGDGHGERAMQALGGVFLSVAKQLGQKTYLTSLHDTLDAVLDPDRRMSKVAGTTLANFIPAASALRFANPDPLMRETRGIVDQLIATVPGLSAKLPPKRDAFGDPLTVHKGLWVNSSGSLVDAEVRRMVDEAGIGPFGPPSPQYRDVDLRDVTMKDGRNAFDALQELAGHPPRGPSMKETIGKIMASPAYQKAPDGDPTAPQHKGTKQAMLTGTMDKYREAARKMLMADPNVRQAVYQQAMKARAAFVAKSAPKSDQQVGAAGLQRMGQAFGVDLGGVLPPGQ